MLPSLGFLDYFFNPACQFVTTVSGGDAAPEGEDGVKDLHYVDEDTSASLLVSPFLPRDAAVVSTTGMVFWRSY